MDLIAALAHTLILTGGIALVLILIGTLTEYLSDWRDRHFS